MTLGIFLSLGESFTALRKQGQEKLMIEQNISFFSQHFDRIFVFTYSKEKVTLPRNCTLVLPPFNIHRYVYALLLPFIHRHLVRNLNCIRCYHLTGTIPALVAKYFFGRKFVFNLGYDYQAFAHIEDKPLIALAFKLLQPLVCQAADRIIVKNKTLLKAINYKLKAKTTYIPNGVDIDRFKPARRKSSSLPTVLFVGRLERQKNLQNLVRAMTQVKTPALLKFVGHGSLQGLLKTQAKALKVPLKIHPPVSHGELVKIYHQASMFVLPSLKEGSPKVLLEAMSCGLPCIVSDIPEHREIIQHQKTGMISKPTSFALSQNIQKLLQHKSLSHQLGIKARQHIVQNFNIKRILKQELVCLRTP